jgi:2-alkyl-3-oxoalkanoate reductase
MIEKNRPRALVTGGTGFLGRRLVDRLLAEGRSVVVLARRPAPDLLGQGVEFVAGAIEERTALERACTGVETVFHVAAKVGVWGPYEQFFRANVLGTRSLLEVARRAGVKYFVHTSTPSVVYNGKDLAGADESLPLTTDCPCAYPLTKAVAEQEVLAANAENFRTVALRPHLIWGCGDPHLVPRILARARAGRLRIVGTGQNRVDMVHVENAVDAHLLAEDALRQPKSRAAGRAYFITNDEPVVLWDWINTLLRGVGEAPITRRVSLTTASALGASCELAWKALRLRGEPPMTRFVAAELAKDHWFDIGAAKRDLGYAPKISMSAGTRELIAWLKARGAAP